MSRHADASRSMSPVMAAMIASGSRTSPSTTVTPGLPCSASAQVGEHPGVVVDVGNPRVRDDGPGGLVRVRRRWSFCTNRPGFVPPS
jgi:hypothetical protein